MSAKVFVFRDVSFWPGAYHVYVGKERYGVVKGHKMKVNGVTATYWESLNSNMLPIEGFRPTREEAAQAIPKPKSATKNKSLARGVG